MARWFGAIEGGGTKWVCAVGDGLGSLDDFVRFETTSPHETLGRAIRFFERQPKPLSALGIGMFGPLDLNEKSPTYGYLTRTPKKGWADTDVLTPFRSRIKGPVVLELDVNVAVVGECRFGAGNGVDNLLYITVGTGIGGGYLCEGTLLHGVVHPEMGHVRVRRAAGDAFEGVCPFHGDCLEGMVSGPAIEARTGISARDLPEEHPVWALVGHYLGEALATYVLVLSPERIVLGGGVMERANLLPEVRQRMQEMLGGYVQHPSLQRNIDTYVVSSALHSRAGVMGALALARDACR